jgi:hypothetical protein
VWHRPVWYTGSSVSKDSISLIIMVSYAGHFNRNTYGFLE